MSATGAMVAGRAAAELLMLDTGTAKRPTGRAYDPEQQAEVDAFDMLLGEAEPVRCKIKPPKTMVREDEVGGRTAVTVPGELHLPASAENATLTEGDIWTMTSVSPLSLSKVGRQYRIKGEVDGTLVTACRYSIERVVS